MTDSDAIQQARQRVATYLPGCAPDLIVERTAGSWVYCQDGSRYLDFGDGGRMMLLGHGCYGVHQALRKHLDSYWYPGSPDDFATLYPGWYAELLSGRFPPVGGRPQQVLLCGSVAEARQRLVELSGNRVMEIRPVSASHSLDGGLVQDLVHQARLAGKLVVADETETGFGRTGTFLAMDRYNLHADAVLLGPSGAAGLSFSALVAPTAFFERAGATSPILVSPLVCAAAYGVLAGLTEPVLAHVAQMGEHLAGVLAEVAAQFSQIERITGVGLLRQVHLTRPEEADRFRRDCRARGLLMSQQLVLTPPLTVTAEEITAAADVIAEVLMEWIAS